jgi:hypothetical protein
VAEYTAARSTGREPKMSRRKFGPKRDRCPSMLIHLAWICRCDLIAIVALMVMSIVTIAFMPIVTIELPSNLTGPEERRVNVHISHAFANCRNELCEFAWGEPLVGWPDDIGGAERA